MKQLLQIVLIFISSASAQAFGYSSGQVDCHFEIASKKNPSRYATVNLPTFDLTKNFSQIIEHPSLDNRLYMEYSPGFTSKNEVTYLVINLAYNMANSGIEAPIVKGMRTTLAIGRQDSDLIGAFLSCTVN